MKLKGVVAIKINLDSRLAAVASFVTVGKVVADIGTDHAYLPVYLIVNNIAPFVIASDCANGPLEGSRRLLELLSLEKKIDLRFGDGLTVLEPYEAQVVCIAGMGGRTIGQILAASPQVASSVERFVLQPQRNTPALRRFLQDNGYKIVGEEMVFEKGFYYVILAVEKGKMKLNNQELEYGPLLLKNGHPFLAPCLRLKLNDIEQILQRLSDKSGKEAAARARCLENEAEQIRAVLADLPRFRD